MFGPERYYTRGITLACVVVFLTQIKYPVLSDLGYFSLETLKRGEVHRIIASGFLHADWRHLINNMIVFYLFSRQLEPLLVRGGWWQYPLVYLGSLAGGSLGHAILHPNQGAIGASGAIFGIVACAGTYSWRLGYSWGLVTLAPGTRFDWILRPIPLLGLLLMGTVQSPDVSSGGHIGGMVAGGIIGLIIAGNDPGKRAYPPDGWG